MNLPRNFTISDIHQKVVELRFLARHGRQLVQDIQDSGQTCHNATPIEDRPQMAGWRIEQSEELLLSFDRLEALFAAFAEWLDSPRQNDVNNLHC